MSVTTQKELGAFYTPTAMAEFLVCWAVREAGDQVLDPSFGGRVFLDAAARRLAALGADPDTVEANVHGVEVDESAFAAAVRPGHDAGRWLRRNFFNVVPGRDVPRVQAVVGNPPYVRYQSFTDSRDAALAVAEKHGLRLTRLSSSWAPFLVHATDFVAPGGRLAQVLPAELIHAQYARDVLAFVAERFNRVVVAIFDERVFPGAQEEIVLLFADAKGAGPARGVELVRCRTLDDLVLPTSPRSTYEPSGDHKLLAGLLPSTTIHAYDQLIESHRQVTRLGTLASVGIGAVTGANGFFVMPAAKADCLPRELLRPAVSKATHVAGARFGRADLRDLDRQGKPSRMFVAGADDPLVADAAVQALLADGEEQGIHERYKCRIRTPWWALPARQVRAPHLFMTYMASEIPRLVMNDAGAASTNNVHGVNLLNGTDRRALVASFYNSLTMLSAELVGRSYGGGVLKLEPTEAERLVIPRPNKSWGDLLVAVDKAVRARRYDDLISTVDRTVLVDGIGLSPGVVARLRDAHELLRARRLARAAG